MFFSSPNTYANEDIGITKFNLTEQEFAKTNLNLNLGAMMNTNFSSGIIIISNAALNAFDSNAKDQTSCDSYWAFSTFGNLEGLYAIEKRTLKIFSEQLLVDCDTNDSGCNGGLMERTFAWLKSAGGITHESDYAYTGAKGTYKKILPNSLILLLPVIIQIIIIIIEIIMIEIIIL